MPVDIVNTPLEIIKSKIDIIDLNHINKDGYTALYLLFKDVNKIAYEELLSHKKKINFLLNKGADPNIIPKTDSIFPSYLYHAINRNLMEDEIPQLLIKKSSLDTINIIDHSGNNIMHILADRGYITDENKFNITINLLEKGINFNQKNNENKTPGEINAIVDLAINKFQEKKLRHESVAQLIPQNIPSTIKEIIARYQDNKLSYDNINEGSRSR